MWKKDIWKRIAAFIFCCGIGYINYRHMIQFHWYDKQYKLVAAIWCIVIFFVLLFGAINIIITYDDMLKLLFKEVGIDIEDKKK